MTGGYFLFRLPFPEWNPQNVVFLTTDPRDAEHILKTNFDNCAYPPVPPPPSRPKPPTNPTTPHRTGCSLS